MRKKITFFVSILAILLVIAACGAPPQTPDVSPTMDLRADEEMEEEEVAVEEEAAEEEMEDAVASEEESTETTISVRSQEVITEDTQTQTEELLTPETAVENNPTTEPFEIQNFGWMTAVVSPTETIDFARFDPNKKVNNQNGYDLKIYVPITGSISSAHPLINQADLCDDYDGDGACYLIDLSKDNARLITAENPVEIQLLDSEEFQFGTVSIQNWAGPWTTEYYKGYYQQDGEVTLLCQNTILSKGITPSIKREDGVWLTVGNGLVDNETITDGYSEYTITDYTGTILNKGKNFQIDGDTIRVDWAPFSGPGC